MIQEIADMEMVRLRAKTLSKTYPNNFVKDDDLDDEFSGDDIRLIQDNFNIQAKQYLDNNYKGQYIIYIDWYVHICHVNFIRNHPELSKKKKFIRLLEDVSNQMES